MPRGLPKNVKKCLEKAHDSALLAVETYNKPAVKFKSGGFIVLMVISWTSLFHAIFFRRKVKPFYKEKNGRRYIKLDGDYKYWELDTCLERYYGDDTGNPLRKNLEFFIKLRNITEHKSLPEIDSNIFGECQAMVLNFDEIMEKEFGVKYCLREALSFSLQLYSSSKNLTSAVTANPSTKTAIDFIQNFRSSLSTTTLESGKFAFKAFLIQVANHPNQSALPIQFIQYDTLSEVERERVKRIAALVKYKYKEVPISNVGLMKPSEVVRRVQEGLGNPIVIRRGKEREKFSIDTHTRCWKRYGIRPDSNSRDPRKTDTKYCVYDDPHEDYLYTEEWVTFLIDKMKDEEEYNSLFREVPIKR